MVGKLQLAGQIRAANWFCMNCNLKTVFEDESILNLFDDWGNQLWTLIKWNEHPPNSSHWNCITKKDALLLSLSLLHFEFCELWNVWLFGVLLLLLLCMYLINIHDVIFCPTKAKIIIIFPLQKKLTDFCSRSLCLHKNNLQNMRKP